MKCPSCKTTELVKADVVLYDAYDCNTCGLEFDVDYLKLVAENKRLRKTIIETLVVMQGDLDMVEASSIPAEELCTSVKIWIDDFKQALEESK